MSLHLPRNFTRGEGGFLFLSRCRDTGTRDRESKRDRHTTDRHTDSESASSPVLTGDCQNDEDWYSLRKRVQRFQTDYAWTEDPQSRIRHHVSNVRTFEGPGDELIVESAVLLYRSRGDRTAPSLLSAGRTDVLIPTEEGLRLRQRDIEIDESVLRTQNLAIFL